MVRMWALAAGVLLLAGCAAAPTETPGALLREYTHDTHVRNDIYPGGGTSADRIANMAAHGTPEDIEASLLGAYPCADNEYCHPDPKVLAAMHTVIGRGTKTRYVTGIDRLYQRMIVVKHHSGQLELVPAYVAKRPDGTPVLIDTAGRTYRDLADYQRNNDLGADDLMLTLKEITAVPGRGAVVVVPGHTYPSPWPWIAGIGGVAVVAAAVAGLVAWRRRTRGPGVPEAVPESPDAYPNRPEM